MYTNSQNNCNLIYCQNNIVKNNLDCDFKPSPMKTKAVKLLIYLCTVYTFFTFCWIKLIICPQQVNFQKGKAPKNLIESKFVKREVDYDDYHGDVNDDKHSSNI